MDALTVRRTPLHTVTFAHYRGADVARAVDSLLDWDGSGYLRGLAAGRLHDRLHLVTASRDGLLVGYLVVDATDGRMRMVNEHIVPGADPGSDIARGLTQLAVDVTASPWGDIEVPRASITVAHLLRDGWHPLPDGNRRPGATIILSGAGVA